jgi:polyisoprenoid-binding protein YceI
MKTAPHLPLALLLLLAAGCDTDPGKGKTQAVANEAVEAPAAEVAPTRSEKWTITSDNSSLEFVGAKITATHEGSFKNFKGVIDLVDGDPTKSKVSLEIQVASLAIDPPKLAGHLKSGDFFDVERFPLASFESTSIEKTDKAGQFNVTGNLELHGVKNSISFPAQLSMKPTAVNAEAEFSIRRKDFGIVYPGMPDDLIKENVLIRFKLNPQKS